MKTTITHRIVLLFLFFFGAQTSNSQIYLEDGEFVIPIEAETFYEGKLLLTNSDTLSGLVSLNFSKDRKYFTQVKDGGNLHVISNGEISKVILYATYKGQKAATNFEKLSDDGKFYRILGVGEVTVYDCSIRPFTGNIVSEVFVKEHNSVRSLFNFWSSGAKQDLVDYINEKENKKFKKRDFKSAEELIAYVAK